MNQNNYHAVHFYKPVLFYFMLCACPCLYKEDGLHGIGHIQTWASLPPKGIPWNKNVKGHSPKKRLIMLPEYSNSIMKHEMPTKLNSRLPRRKKQEKQGKFYIIMI